MSWVRDKLQLQTLEKSSEEEIESARRQQIEKGQGSVFDALTPVESDSEGAIVRRSKPTRTEHKYSTANFKISHRKLNLLGRQIAGKPIDSAILQMSFSEKRASKRIKSMLVVAKDHAQKLGMDEKKLVIAESWVSKGPNVHKRIDIKGRGRYGIKQHPDSKLSVVLKEGRTRAELMEEFKAKRLRRIVSAGMVREDVPLRNPSPRWAW